MDEKCVFVQRFCCLSHLQNMKGWKMKRCNCFLVVVGLALCLLSGCSAAMPWDDAESTAAVMTVRQLPDVGLCFVSDDSLVYVPTDAKVCSCGSPSSVMIRACESAAAMCSVVRPTFVPSSMMWLAWLALTIRNSNSAYLRLEQECLTMWCMVDCRAPAVPNPCSVIVSILWSNCCRSRRNRL